MVTIVTRSGKGSPLTNTEMDANLNNLNSGKTENSSAAITGGYIDGVALGANSSIVSIVVSGNATFTSTGAVKLPAGTEAQRPTGVAGQLRFNSNTVQFEGYNGTDWGSIGGSVEWIAVANTYTASSGDAIIATTTAGSFTVTLPSSPLTGAIVIIADGDDFYTNPLTVNGNSNLIEGYNTFTLNVKNVKVEFIYSGTSWQAFPTITTLTSDLSTNLTLTSNSSTVSINSDNGTDVTILAANSTAAGVLTATNQTIAGDKTFTGNVGIGSTAPQGKMEIRNSSNGVVTNALTISNFVANSVNTGVGLYFDPNGAGSVARAASIQSVQSTAGNHADFRFFTAAGDTPAERMRITDTGKLLVGNTASRGSFFEVERTDNDNAIVDFKTNNASGDVIIRSSGGFVRLRATGTNDLAFFSASTERMRIVSNGNVGIGTSSPAAQLHVSGSNNPTCTFTGAITSSSLVDQAGILTVSAVSSGTIAVGDLIYGTNVSPITKVLAFGTGTGTTGTYVVSVYQNVANTTMYAGSGTASKIRISETDTQVVAGQSIGTIEFFTNDEFVGSFTGNPPPSAGVGAYISAIAEGTNVNASLVFGTRRAVNSSSADANERLRIDSLGNVGIGQRDPSAWLINGIGIGSGSSDWGATIYTGTGSSGYLCFADGTTTTDRYRGYLQYAHTSDTMVFGTSAQERVRITSDGRFYVNQTTGNGNTLQRMGITYDGATEWAFAVKTTTATGNAISFQNSSGTQVGVISQNNTSTGYVTSSDYRLKQNITPMTGALAKIVQLNPVTYNWKIDGSDGQGFIAHELQAVIPDCVTGEKDAVDDEGNPRYQGVDASFLVATLVAAIKEQQVNIATLTEAVQEQQAIVTALETRLATLESAQ